MAQEARVCSFAALTLHTLFGALRGRSRSRSRARWCSLSRSRIRANHLVLDYDCDVHQSG